MGADGCQVLALADKVPKISVLAMDVERLLPLAAALNDRDNIDLIASEHNPLAASTADIVYMEDACAWDWAWLPKIADWLCAGGSLLLAGTFRNSRRPETGVGFWPEWETRLRSQGLVPRFMQYNIEKEIYDADGEQEHSVFQAVIKAVKEFSDADR